MMTYISTITDAMKAALVFPESTHQGLADGSLNAYDCPLFIDVCANDKVVQL